MAKQTVNIGTNQDDGTGDVLRDAFKKINDNFDEIYTELGGVTLSGLSYTGTTIGTDTSGADITIDVTSTGRIVLAGPVSISETLAVTGNTTLTGTLDVDGNTDLDDVAISGNLTVGGTTTLTGDLSGGNAAFTGTLSANGAASFIGDVDLGDTTTDTVTFVGRVGSSIVPSITETSSLGSSTLRWDTVYAKDGNFSGNITLGGNITIGDADTDSITVNADLTSNLIPNASSTYNIGSVTRKWATVYADTINAASVTGATSFGIGNLSFSGNSISNVVSNENITLDPLGTGTVVVPSLRLGTFTSTQVLFTDALGNITSNSNLTQSGVTTTIENLRINDLTIDNNNITSTSNIELQPASGIIDVKNAVIDNLANPTLGDHATTKDYVDTATNQPITFSDDTSTIIEARLGETISISGGAGITTSGGGATITITNSDTWDTFFTRNTRTVPGLAGLNIDKVVIDDTIEINQTDIKTIVSNADLVLDANGTGRIIVRTSLDVDETLNVTGATTLSSTLGVTGDATFSGDISNSRIRIRENTITTLTSNEPLVLSTNGLGNVRVDEHLSLQAQTADPVSVSGFSTVFSRTFASTTRAFHADSDGDIVAIAPREYTPASAVGATGDRKGDMAWDSSYIYTCVANYDGSTAIWRRAAHATW